MNAETKKSRRITEQELRQLQQNCRQMLREHLCPTAASRLKRAAKKALGRAGANETDPLFWPVGLLLMGLVESGRALRDEEALRQVCDYLKHWLEKDGVVHNLDDTLAGVAALRLLRIPADKAPRHDHADAAQRETAPYDHSDSVQQETAPRDHSVLTQQEAPRHDHADAAQQETAPRGHSALTQQEVPRHAHADAAQQEAPRQDHPDSAQKETALCARPDFILRETVSRVFTFLKTAPTDAEGSLLYHPSAHARFVFADGAGMAALFLREYAEFCDSVTHDQETAREAEAMARTQLANYLKYGMDSRTGLPYHGYALRKRTIAGSLDLASPDNGSIAPAVPSSAPEQWTSEKQGLVGWGRAVGFLAMGGLPGLTKTALACQRPDGFYSWLLPALDGHIDTSATAMLGIAIAASPDAAAHETALTHLETALLTRLNDGRITDSLAECVDFAEHPQRYGVNLWGMGSSLLFLSQRYCSRIV